MTRRAYGRLLPDPESTTGPPDIEASDGPEADPPRRRLPGPALVVISAALIGLVVAGYVGDALAPTLVDTHPLVLLLLNPRIRNLVLITNQLDTATYYVAGTLRLVLSDPLFYLVGYSYGDAAVRWTERRAPTY